MRQKPQRPQPTEKVLDYDDGDPYSCIAAGREEERLQQRLQRSVEECYGEPEQRLERLAEQDLASVKTALYDIWDRERSSQSNPELGDWAAAQMGRLGDRRLLDYERP
ncbi:hypothetical protein JST97_09275 [bacterium]|nr:hypothetical protein [bacterium]